MCGIVGYTGKGNNALEILINGLETLEYRGYDSAGVAFVNNKKINIIKEKGKIKNLKDKIDFNINSNVGIGHTRWATHGIPNKINSHPQTSGKITIVHNGIIENYIKLKEKLTKLGYKFESQTDTEVACTLLDYLYSINNNDMLKTIVEFKKEAKGSYALGILCNDQLDKLYSIRKDSPLIVACGESANYIASDVPAILRYTNKYIILESDEIAVLDENKVTIYNDNLKTIEKKINVFEGELECAMKNGYEHFMLKEINEEPKIVNNLSNKYSNLNDLIDKIPNLDKYNNIDIVACGSAYHTGLVAKNLIEKFAEIPVNVEIASEYRYKKQIHNENTLVILVSQSGETADTLFSLRKVKENNTDTLAIVNVVGSSISREAMDVVYINAGPEIAVATTKAYSTQTLLLSLIALKLSYINNKIDKKEVTKVLTDLKQLQTHMNDLINKDYKEIANNIYKDEDVFFLGRGIDYSISLEGSLKLKEISYIHSEAYPAGELKHGTISLIDNNVPVVAIITNKLLAEKTISNIKEVKARGAKVILLIREDLNISPDCYDELITIPKVNEFLQPILTIIPLQLLSYEVAKLRECDIDKPKNLAKSVTVE